MSKKNYRSKDDVATDAEAREPPVNLHRPFGKKSPNTGVPIVVTLTPDLIAALQAQFERTGLSRQDIVRTILRRVLLPNTADDADPIYAQLAAFLMGREHEVELTRLRCAKIADDYGAHDLAEAIRRAR